MPSLPGVSHRYVVVDGVRLHVAEAGTGPAIVLLHGWPQHWWAWRRVLPALARDHHVICPDLRGLGWSQAPPEGYEKQRLADDLIGVLDALELDRVKLVGHDWGGLAAFLAALQAPERFSGLLALSISHLWPPAVPPDPRRLIRFAYQGVIASPLGERLLRHQGLSRGLLERAGEGVWDAEALDVYARVLSRPPAARASVMLYRTFLLHELGPLLRGAYSDRRLEVPTRMLVGDRDPVITAELVAGLQDHADPGTVAWEAGAGHWLPEERPERVLAELALLP